MTFGLKEQMQQARRMHSADDNTVGFTGTEMYSWLNTELYNQLPADLRGVIKTTDKKTCVGGGNGQIRCDSMKIFLFSEEECFGRAIQSAGGESASNESYPIFTDDASRVKILPGPQIIEWWLRSPRYEGETQFCLVHSTGSGWLYQRFLGIRRRCFRFLRLEVKYNRIRYIPLPIRGKNPLIDIRGFFRL